MSNQNLHPEIQTILIHYLQTWRSNSTPTYIPSNSTLQTALYQQKHIGHLQFIEGYWSRLFNTCLSTHLNNINNTQSSLLLFLSKTQRRIWQIAWALWEHRNKFLHDRNKSFHPKEIKNLQEEITI